MRTLHGPSLLLPLPLPLPLPVHPPVPSAAATAVACNVNAMCRKNNYGCKLRNFCAPTPSACPCPSSPSPSCAPLASVFRVIPHPPCNAFCLPKRGRERKREGEGEQQHIGAALSSNVQFCCSCHAPLWRGETLVNVLATCCGNCTRTQLEVAKGEDIISIYRHRHRHR